jgi:hypothetical protein
MTAQDEEIRSGAAAAAADRTPLNAERQLSDRWSSGTSCARLATVAAGGGDDAAHGLGLVEPAEVVAHRVAGYAPVGVPAVTDARVDPADVVAVVGDGVTAHRAGLGRQCLVRHPKSGE